MAKSPIKTYDIAELEAEMAALQAKLDAAREAKAKERLKRFQPEGQSVSDAMAESLANAFGDEKLSDKEILAAIRGYRANRPKVGRPAKASKASANDPITRAAHDKWKANLARYERGEGLGKRTKDSMIKTAKKWLARPVVG